MSESTTTAPEYDVVVNDEEQYSIWAVGRAVPAGWHAVGVSGTKEKCLEHVEEVWTDMRPKSLRLAMGEN
ncbi:MbtH family protein [Umezawaea endophytica]|uniref:MbtH family NRPS accessory protein n=1 Tax=Umezawaea endophytica TaxID=1654476 RepID=A0A9X2VIC2_9PSEU|nr:MbtH family NRPS accessory protein [Umezawaea endophytica]MCS7475568.1 MbtH family NRPS accessory protein [Umezawaea endophytica]